MKDRLFLLFSLILFASVVSAQQYLGMSGLIHVPSADMNKEGGSTYRRTFPEQGTFTR